MFGVTNSSDTRIIQQVLAGKREAFGALVDRYLALVHAVAYSRVRNRPDAEDAAQETFLPRATRLFRPNTVTLERDHLNSESYWSNTARFGVGRVIVWRVRRGELV